MMEAKIISNQQAANMVQSGMTVMVGGFLNCGSPNSILHELLQSQVGELSVISNDTAFPDRGIGTLIVNKQIAALYVSHVGTNPETGKQMNSGEIKVDLIPQGTLAERVRCGGNGLGGFLTPTGAGTSVQEGKPTMTIEGKKYLLEMPLKADVALIKAYKADKMGNLVYRSSARNFNPLMATAAKIVIAEVEHIVETGELSPDEIITPAVFVDYLTLSTKD